MTLDDALQIALMFLFGAFGLVAVAWSLTLLIPLLRKNNLTPGEQAVLTALLPYMHTAIHAFAQMIIDATNKGQAAVDAIQFDAIAGGVYDTLNGTLHIGAIPVPISVIKFIVSRDKFVQGVDALHAEEQAFIKRNEAYLLSLVAATDVPAPSIQISVAVPADAVG